MTTTVPSERSSRTTVRPSARRSATTLARRSRDRASERTTHGRGRPLEAVAARDEAERALEPGGDRPRDGVDGPARATSASAVATTASDRDVLEAGLAAGAHGRDAPREARTGECAAL